jgi:dTDP-4-amino-4,6-dideoxygalactose transaminase
LHLALILAGVSRDDEVVCSSLTFAGAANPIVYQGARPVFVDSDTKTWCMDAQLLAEELDACARHGRLPKAVVLVHLYGQTGDVEGVRAVCAAHDIVLIEDAAEALGARCGRSAAGALGDFGTYSFNGNKIITTSGGGMLVTHDAALADRARYLATQARDPAPHYEHSVIGYNYRLSNVLAAIGRAQLQALGDRVEQKRRVFHRYAAHLAETPGIDFMPEPQHGTSTRWLTVVTVDAAKFGASRDEVRARLEARDIESRAIWKPMHTQPVFEGCRSVGGRVSEVLFETGLCLPSGTQLTESEIDRVTETILETPHGV